MKRIPMTMVHKPVNTNRANISFGDIEMDSFRQCSQGPY